MFARHLESFSSLYHVLPKVSHHIYFHGSGRQQSRKLSIARQGVQSSGAVAQIYLLSLSAVSTLHVLSVEVLSPIITVHRIVRVQT